MCWFSTFGSMMFVFACIASSWLVGCAKSKVSGPSASRSANVARRCAATGDSAVGGHPERDVVPERRDARRAFDGQRFRDAGLRRGWRLAAPQEDSRRRAAPAKTTMRTARTRASHGADSIAGRATPVGPNAAITASNPRRAAARSTSASRSSLLTSGGDGRKPSTLGAALRPASGAHALQQRGIRRAAFGIQLRQRRRQPPQARHARTSDRASSSGGALPSGASAAPGCA